MAFKIFATLSTLAVSVHGFWRMECNGMAGLARIDPLVSPGEVSAHVHALFGSSNLALDSTPADLRAGDCTSCAVVEDKSGYWQPALYFEHANGTIEYVGIKGDTGIGNAGILAYYKLLNDNGTQESGVTAFPEGFRMIAGNSNTRSPPAELAALGLTAFSPDPPKTSWGETSQALRAFRAIGFNCIDPAVEPSEGTLLRHYLPSVEEVRDLQCKGGLRTEIVFPSCWNGNDYDVNNPHAHVAYPDLTEDGRCPSDFDIRLPTLLFEAIWDTMKFVDLEGRFLLSNGDTTGFGMHADFMNGWDQATLEAAVATCHNPSGRIQDCPVFTLQDKQVYESCKISLPDELANETVQGALLTSLPGNQQITEPGEELDDPLAVNAIPSNEIPDSTPESTIEFSQPQAEVTSEPQTEFTEPAAMTTSASSPNSESIEPIETEPPSLIDDPEDVQYSVISTEYRTEGNKVFEIVWEEAWVYVTEDLTATVTVSTSPSRMRRDRAKRAHAHNHRGLHHPHW